MNTDWKNIDLNAFKQEILKKYPAKTARKRAKQIIVNEVDARQEVPAIQANVRTIPGILTMRGCAYAGCRGVGLGPTRDILQIVHGPIGCSYYAWLTRRNQTRPESADDPNFMNYALSTDMQEEEIIFGGEKKLKQAIDEAVAIFHPKAIGIFATCPVGLIGDDIHAVAREMEKKYPGINVFGFSCEGYKGVSQSAGHHIANNKIFTDVVGQSEFKKPGAYRMNLLGEYNIGGDAFEIDRLFGACGLTLHSTFSGNSVYEEFASAHTVDLNLVMCHRSINYMAEMMEKKYGIPWLKVNFIGAEATAKSLVKIAQYYESKELEDTVKAFIKNEMEEVRHVAESARKVTLGKTAMLFVGGSRAHHYQELFRELGMETISAGYEFAHRDDYEGRKVLPGIVVDADSRNIEELEVVPDEKNYQPRITEERKKKLAAKDIKLGEYEGMMPEMPNNTLVIDDINHHETELLIEKFKPSVFCAGIKEKYIIQKHGIPLKQLHSYDYSGPYAGFRGAINFYKEIERLVTSPVRDMLKAPWEKKPELSARYVLK